MGQVIDQQIQFLVMDAFTKDPEQPWSNFVVNNFDNDIDKGMAQLDSSAYLKSIAYSSDSLQSIHSGVFNYTLCPGHTFEVILKHLNKYKEHGFELGSLNFDTRVSEAWRNHILLEFQFHLMQHSHLWINEYEETSGIHLLDTIIKEHILPFLNPHLNDDLQVQNRNILLDAIRSEVERRGGYDPDHHAVSIENVEPVWEYEDAEEEEEEAAAGEEGAEADEIFIGLWKEAEEED